MKPQHTQIRTALIAATAVAAGALAATTLSIAQTPVAAPTQPAASAQPQTPTSASNPAAAAPATRQAAAARYVDSSTPVLSLGEIESRAVAQGLVVKEIEVEGLIAEVEGYDVQNRKVELKIDRRSGEVLAAKVKEPRR